MSCYFISNAADALAFPFDQAEPVFLPAGKAPQRFKFFLAFKRKWSENTGKNPKVRKSAGFFLYYREGKMGFV